MPIESEIKLRLAPKHLLKVSEHPLISAYAQQGPICQHLQSTYFDTPDLRLLQQKLGLRIRWQGKQWIQTLKGDSSGEAGLHRRQEWESVVDSNTPTLERLAPEAKVGVLGDANLEAHLIPVFATDFWRTSWILQVASKSILELALDEGYIRACERVEPLSEVELELKQGQEKDLYRVALQLAVTLPVAIEHASKAERGYRLYRQQFSPLIVPTPLPVGTDNRRQLLGHWLACLQYGERLLLERDDPRGISYLRATAKELDERLATAEERIEAALQADLDWLVSGLQESKGFTEIYNLVAAPRYSRLLLHLGLYLTE